MPSEGDWEIGYRRSNGAYEKVPAVDRTDSQHSTRYAVSASSYGGIGPAERERSQRGIFCTDALGFQLRSDHLRSAIERVLLNL